MNARTWFITGAASGFGYHLTTQLLSRGDRVIATDLRPARRSQRPLPGPPVGRGP
jgi:NAD(P)-dependent dehydrogenase (short-subunit alcohol dehydrogenase family)